MEYRSKIVRVDHQWFQSPFDKSVHLGADGMITDDLEMIQDQVTIAQETQYTEFTSKQAMEFFNFSKQKETIVPYTPMMKQVFS